MTRLRQIKQLAKDLYGISLSDRQVKQINEYENNNKSARTIVNRWFDIRLFIESAMFECNKDSEDIHLYNNLRDRVFSRLQYKRLRSPEQVKNVAKTVLRNVVRRYLEGDSTESDSEAAAGSNNDDDGNVDTEIEEGISGSDGDETVTEGEDAEDITSTRYKSSKRKCCAVTKLGRKCKNVSSVGKYCPIHAKKTK